MVETLSVLVLLGTGLVAGVLFAVAISVMPALIAMTPDRYVDTHKLLGKRYDRIMPFIVSGSVLVDAALAVRADHTSSRVLFIAAALAMAGVAVVSQTRNVPINNRVKKTRPQDLGPGWEDPRFQWRDWHLLRTCFAIGGCTLTAAAVVLS
ncbi:anthrone oxygenase family protein [Streptomyces sp. NPDC090119]|uniref:anthrone oxygenase family protein n=1 Tax=Streptomyces sp. NPDC090119 TaxID=3365951 RepID=UPI003803BCAB